MIGDWSCTMTDSTLIEFRDPRTRLYSLTVEQYHEMIEQGILPEGEPYELLNGTLVRKDRSAAGEDPMTVGDDHTFAVMQLQRLNPVLERAGCHMRIQQPVSLPPHDEPEPDGAIVTGQIEDYIGRKPVSSDILCVIEVADSSLRRDRTTKQQIYAAGNVARYFLINLQQRVIEEFSQPIPDEQRYDDTTVYKINQKLSLPSARGKGLTVAVSQFFPPVKGRGSRNGKHR